MSIKCNDTYTLEIYDWKYLHCGRLTILRHSCIYCVSFSALLYLNGKERRARRSTCLRFAYDQCPSIVTAQVFFLPYALR